MYPFPFKFSSDDFPKQEMAVPSNKRKNPSPGLEQNSVGSMGEGLVDGKHWGS